ncbi:hypothetical protein [Nostoc sp.]|uniref:hypothetical protein n=1 Tax=Nostoc sp. TaxID=1180 RepID=UPI002FF7CDBF
MLFIPLNILTGLGFYYDAQHPPDPSHLASEAQDTAVSFFAFSLFVGQGIGVAVFGRIVDNFS